MDDHVGVAFFQKRQAGDPCHDFQKQGNARVTAAEKTKNRQPQKIFFTAFIEQQDDAKQQDCKTQSADKGIDLRVCPEKIHDMFLCPVVYGVAHIRKRTILRANDHRVILSDGKGDEGMLLPVAFPIDDGIHSPREEQTGLAVVVKRKGETELAFFIFVQLSIREQKRPMIRDLLKGRETGSL
ncbi:MAG: hypothetical protein IKQ96_04555 [Lachnospiraceae bacterium]|nr:hypothetical protein [Lachnospiraceae bacterium]